MEFVEVPIHLHCVNIYVFLLNFLFENSIIKDGMKEKNVIINK